MGDHSDLIRVDPIERAMAIKFARGRKEYGDAEWVGPAPLICAHDEILDCLVYLDQHLKGGQTRKAPETMTHELVKQARNLCQGVRLLIDIEGEVDAGQDQGAAESASEGAAAEPQELEAAPAGAT